MRDAPSGTVTFLFTDIEGSTRRWEERPAEMRVALAVHDEILHDAIEMHGGHLVKNTGDGAFAVFTDAHDGVDAALAAQVALATAEWPGGVGLRVRMGLHLGAATVQDGDYVGTDVNRTARLMSVAHGGQIVCSRPVRDLVSDRFALVDLGEHRLRDLYSSVHVFQVDVPGSESAFPPLRSLDARPGNLPRQITTFVGRETLIASLARLVLDCPVLTLTGVGGVGKTRLALQVAAEVVADFPDGAWVCEFAPVTDRGAVWDALATSLRVQVLPGRTLEESVLEFLAAKQLLLVLDNCEHLLQQISGQVDAITQRCERVTVIATSREGLGLAGERIVAVPTLTIPAHEADIETLLATDAVRLFSDRANAANADFRLSDHNASTVGVLCRRLDGIPLAIELAAARVRSLAPEDLVARLDQRFKLLSRGSRSALEHHQTLRSTIDWSYDLLDPAERHALDRLSVFAGSCDLTAAESVLVSDDLDVLDAADVLGQLVDKSLVVAEADELDGGVRYRLLESIRQYAAERLAVDGETAAVRRRHADHYVGVAETVGPHLRNGDQIEWAHAALRDLDNFRAVLEWSADEPSSDHALRLVAPFTVTGMAIGVAALDWAEVASAIPGAADHPLYPEVAAFASLGATFAADFERAEARVVAAERTQAALGTPVSPVLTARAVLAIFQGDPERARRYSEEWVEIARAAADPYELSHALLPLAGTHHAEPDIAIILLEEAIEVSRSGHIANSLSIALPFLAGLLPKEDSVRALTLLDEAIEVSTRLGDRWGVSLVTSAKGSMAYQHGDRETTLSSAVEMAEQRIEIGELSSMSLPFYLGGLVLYELGCPEPAGVLIGKADAIVHTNVMGEPLTSVLQHGEITLLEVRDQPGFAALADRGAALGNAAATEYLRAQSDALLRGSPRAGDP
ncbi:MAG TPA: adenylate/guanylate cyclase domain-containing protein [Acidimicrobiales bacterium]